MPHAEIVQLFPVMVPAQADVAKRRLWLVPGVPLIIGHGVLLTLSVDRDGDREHMTVTISGRVKPETLPLTPQTWLDMSAWAGLMMVPLACQYTRRGSIAGVYVEFALIGRNKFCVN